MANENQKISNKEAKTCTIDNPCPLKRLYRKLFKKKSK